MICCCLQLKKYKWDGEPFKPERQRTHDELLDALAARFARLIPVGDLVRDPEVTLQPGRCEERNNLNWILYF